MVNFISKKIKQLDIKIGLKGIEKLKKDKLKLKNDISKLKKELNIKNISKTLKIILKDELEFNKDQLTHINFKLTAEQRFLRQNKEILKKFK